MKLLKIIRLLPVLLCALSGQLLAMLSDVNPASLPDAQQSLHDAERRGFFSQKNSDSLTNNAESGTSEPVTPLKSILKTPKSILAPSNEELRRFEVKARTMLCSKISEQRLQRLLAREDWKYSTKLEILMKQHPRILQEQPLLGEIAPKKNRKVKFNRTVRVIEFNPKTGALEEEETDFLREGCFASCSNEQSSQKTVDDSLIAKSDMVRKIVGDTSINEEYEGEDSRYEEREEGETGNWESEEEYYEGRASLDKFFLLPRNERRQQARECLATFLSNF